MVLIVLGLLFFLSGASALVFQVAWLRLLALVFGVTVHAARAVLASFMGGLALGDGLAVQWIGHREEMHYKLIMRTFLKAYPHATLWADGGVMVGSLRPLSLSREAYERRFAAPSDRAALTRVGLDSFDAVLARYTAGPEEMQRFVGDGPILTDDRPLLEYHRSIRDSGPPVDLSSLRGDINRYLRP